MDSSPDDPIDPIDPIDVRELLKRVSVDELNAKAEEYFARNENPDQLLAKPFGTIEETPQLLVGLGILMGALALRPGQRLLDLGVGTGWTSRIFAQLGLQVVAVDVSPSALSLAQRATDAHPLFGPRPAPSWTLFDGRRLPLDDASVDRVVCFDAFHHIPNWPEVLGEIARVLRPGGIAGFYEPGPHHSLSSNAQFEMRMFGVVENDIVVEDIWRHAQTLGFESVRLALFGPEAALLTLDEFADVGRQLDRNDPSVSLPAEVRAPLQHCVAYKRAFLLTKGGVGEPDEARDSRRAEGLAATLEVELISAPETRGAHFPVTVRVTNTGQAAWLPAGPELGAVWLGAHHHDSDGRLLRQGHLRSGVPPASPQRVEPGATLEFVLNVPAPQTPGRHAYRFDLVAEQVAWFSVFGMHTPTVWFLNP